MLSPGRPGRHAAVFTHARVGDELPHLLEFEAGAHDARGGRSMSSHGDGPRLEAIGTRRVDFVKR